MRHQARVHAVQALYQSELIESKASGPVDRFLEHSELPEKMRDFTRELAVGTLHHRKYIDRRIRRNLDNWRLNRLSVIIRNILRLGVYEMCFGPEISHRIVINESVELCKDFVDDDSHGLVNRVLQKIWDQHQEYIAEKTSGEKSTSAESTESEPELPSEQAPSTPAQYKDSESSAL
jgi:N utilization substance protein B